MSEDKPKTGNRERFFLEQSLLGELDPEKEETIQGDPAMEQIKEKLERESEAIRLRYPPAAMAEKIRHHNRRRRRAAFPRLIALLPLAAAALTVTVIGTGLWENQKPAQAQSGDAGIRIKGLEPDLRIYRQRGDRVVRLENQARAGYGDRLQLEYLAAGYHYGVIISIDGTGTVTLHYPEAAQMSTELEGGEAIILPYSYELDNAPGFERFLFIAADRPLDTRDIIKAARRLPRDRRESALDLPADYRQISVTLLKEANQ